MKMINHKLRFFIIFLIVVVIGFGIYYFLEPSFSAQNKVSPDFIQANQQAALISQSIVSFANQSANDLAQINQMDNSGDYVDALNLTSQIFDKNFSIRNQAVLLSNELVEMTKALSTLDNFQAKQLALEAISDRLALINGLINYSDYLNRLLLYLRLRFTDQPVSRTQIESLISQLNAEIRSINALNDQATADMNQFNKITQ
jgi:hypothetical protein